MDMIFNGNARGSFAQDLLASGMDVDAYRLFIGEDGLTYRNRMVGNELHSELVTNAAATLRYEDWREFDEVAVQAARPGLIAVGDLFSRNLRYNIPNGLGRSVLTFENMSDTSKASVTMDPAESSNTDRPTFQLVNMPLPVIHKDFFLTARAIAESRNGGTPLDTTGVEQASRKVAEEAESLLVGTAADFAFAGSHVYGYLNFPKRLKQVITSPEASGWTPDTLIGEVLKMLKASRDAFHYGPWVLYYGPAWGPYLDNEYKKESSDTLATRLGKMQKVEAVRMLESLTGYDIVLVQMTSNVVREVVGMEITTLQYDTIGGMRRNFKVMAIMLPQLRADFYDRTGIVHGYTA